MRSQFLLYIVRPNTCSIPHGCPMPLKRILHVDERPWHGRTTVQSMQLAISSTADAHRGGTNRGAPVELVDLRYEAGDCVFEHQLRHCALPRLQPQHEAVLQRVWHLVPDKGDLRVLEQFAAAYRRAPPANLFRRRYTIVTGRCAHVRGGSGLRTIEASWPACGPRLPP